MPPRERLERDRSRPSTQVFFISLFDSSVEKIIMPGEKAIQINDIILTYQGPLMYEAKVCVSIHFLLVYLLMYTHMSL